jgi:RHS repeat-associated protein
MDRSSCLLLVALTFAIAGPARATAPELAETPEVRFAAEAAAPLRERAAALDTPVAIYEYLRNTHDHALYHGSRSGSINTLLGERGNDVDLASTLIALLRSRGFPARYAVGDVRVGSQALLEWLGVRDLDLAVALLRDQGLQHVALAPDRTHVDFEHVWVEVLTPYLDYRGAGPGLAGSGCGATPGACAWIPIDPSFKPRAQNADAIDVYDRVSFDFDAYYAALANGDRTRRDRNPLEIYEAQVLALLRTAHPGKTLEDVAYQGAIIPERAGLLPASLPYTVLGTPRRYSSVDEHDRAVPAIEPKRWRKVLRLTAHLAEHIRVGMGEVSLVDLGTERLTLTYELGDPERLVLRLGGRPIAVPIVAGSLIVNGQVVGLGFPFSLELALDGVPGATPEAPDRVITASYGNLVVGGYYLIGTGGETSNWSQLHRAAAELLQASGRYPVVHRADEPGCGADGVGCTPYVDLNRTGWDSSDPRLLDHPEAMDALTGGLLHVAMADYFARFRDAVARLDALDHVRSPIEGFVGVVSSVYDVEYVDGTAFSVLPGGLLIDMKGQQFAGNWRIDAPATAADRHFELLGHVMSSLEHEVWQELTGYDAVSTVRGLQMALADGASLVRARRSPVADTVAGAYGPLGFGPSAPAGFTIKERRVYSTRPVTWSHASEGAEFDLFKTRVDSSTPQLRRALGTYTYHRDAGYSGWIRCVDKFEDDLDALYASRGNISVSAFTYCDGTVHSGRILTVQSELRDRYLNHIIPNVIGTDTAHYFDKFQGFVPADHVYRIAPPAAEYHDTAMAVELRNALDLADPSVLWRERVMASRKTTGDTYRFAVYVHKDYDSQTGHLVNQSYQIQNHSLAAGGGYVDASLPLEPATALPGTSRTLPAFENRLFTDQLAIAGVNNDRLRTPSTADPVSTVTGNNFHDETDLTIRGRGLDYAFTRTYNSAPAATSRDGPIGYGWTHSYAMRLQSRDHGACPNCAPGTGAGADPSNGDGVTSSIAFLDERGGEHLYLVEGTARTVTAPPGEFESLMLDHPTAGSHTLAFRNGVRYVFEVPGGGDLKTTPDLTARLTCIEDPYANVIAFLYDAAGRLDRVVDNLAIPDRTGLAFRYDAAGHLDRITDWTGRVWDYTVDAAGNLTAFTNPRGDTVTYTYHGSHRLHEVILPELREGGPVRTAFSYYRNGRTFGHENALGFGETLDYDLYRQTTRVTDPRGFVRTYRYDPGAGALLELREPDGGILTFENTTEGMRYRKTDALGHQSLWSYRADRGLSSLPSDSGGLVTLEQDPLGETVEHAYGVYDQPTVVVDKRGHAHTRVYYGATDSASGAVKGRLAEVRATVNGAPDVTLERYTYHADPAAPAFAQLRQRIEYLDPADPGRRRVTDYAYETGSNGLNLAEAVVSGSGQSVRTTYAHDRLGRRTGVTLWRRSSPLDATRIPLTTSYEYDALDRVTRITDPLGQITETLYDRNGRVAAERVHHRQADGTYVVRAVATHRYDAADRRVATIDVDGHATRFAYDESGNLVAETDANGRTTRYEYDPMGRRTTVIDGAGHRSETTHDRAGRPAASRDASGRLTLREHDALGRVTRVVSPGGRETRERYDANGNPTCTVDANAAAGLVPTNAYGCSEYREYDERNRLTRVVDALGGETRYSYDLLGNLTAMTDAAGRRTRYRYDDLGRLLEEIDPLVESPADKTVTYSYDEAGNLLTRTNRLGQVTRHTYDRLNRLIRTEHLADGTQVVFNYDAFGNLTQIGNAELTYTLAYDARHRLLSVRDSRLGKTLAFSYDPAGNVASKTDYQGEATTYQRDAANRLVAERNPAYLQVSYHYDPAGRLLNRILSNGARADYAYDADGRLSGLTHTAPGGVLVLEQLRYTRDAVGHVIEIASSREGTTSYAYDPLYRLIRTDYPGTSWDETFTYDAVGNRLTHLRGGTTRYYQYLAGSNRLASIRLNSPTGTVEASFAYDLQGRLTKRTGSNPLTLTWDQEDRARSINGLSFGYDPRGYRVRITDAAGTRLHHLEGEHLESVYAPDGTLQAKHLRGAVIDELVNGYHTDGPTPGDWLNLTFHHDPLQSVTALTGHAGTLEETASYSAFGETRTRSGTTGNPIGFTGREHDPETGLYYFRARYYDPGIGRFLSEDPLGLASGDVNFYSYVANNPLNANDPTGKSAGDVYAFEPSDWIGKAIARASGGPYSHIGIEISQRQILEARPGDGVGIRPLADAVKGRSFDVYRSVRGSPTTISTLENYAAFATGATYDYLAYRGTPDRGGNAYVCSTVVDDAARFSGLGATGRWTISAAYYTGGENGRAAVGVNGFPSPNDIITASSFQLVASTSLPATLADVGLPAAGGFVLYPSKPNSNLLQQVYRK